jgi:hypothetical protein
MQLYLFRNILGFFLLYNIQQKTPKNTIVNYVMLYVTNYVNIIKIFLPKKHKMVKYNQKNAKKRQKILLQLFCFHFFIIWKQKSCKKLHKIIIVKNVTDIGVNYYDP